MHSPYTRGIHHEANHAIKGPSVGPDAFTGFRSSITFDTQEEVDKAILVANAAYRAGRYQLQQEIKKSLSL
jgi:hypothetical protein